MAAHRDLGTPDDIHVPAYVTGTDPALDVANFVTPGKLWVDTSSGPPYQLKIRNTGDTDWDSVGVASSSSSISWKQAVRAASTANVTLASGVENGDTLDGVTLATGDRILLKNQSAGAENGIYTVNASGAPTRATDADSGAELVGMAVIVQEGTVNADKAWILTTNAPITPGTTALVYAAFGAGGGGSGSISSGAYASRPAAGNAGAFYLAEDGDRSYLDDGAAWKAFGPVHKMAKPPLVATWTWVNQGGAAAVDNQDSIFLTVPLTAGAATSARGLFRAAPSTPYVITAVLGLSLNAVATNQFGIGFRQSSDGKLATLHFGVQAANPQIFLTVAKYTSPTVFSASYATKQVPSIYYPAFLRIENNGTNRICSFSVDGLNWEVLHTVSNTDFLTADQVGFFGDASNASVGPSGSLLSWLVE